MIKFVATTFYEGIGHETLYILAENEDGAFRTLFNYYRDSGTRLGDWLDGNGNQAGDFDSNAGIFDRNPDWDYFIAEEPYIKTIGG